MTSSFSSSSGSSAPSANAIVRVGRNAGRLAVARRMAVLVDAASYFAALEQAIAGARRAIWIVGWDFNPMIRLRPQDPASRTIGELLREAVERQPELEVRILVWAMGPIYSGKTLRFFGEMAWNAHPRITMRFDRRHPLRASHHQKLVSIDDALAFLGGIDLTARRWDDREHAADNPLRLSPDGTAYGPVHDAQSVVAGSAAKLVGDVARRRWRKATGETVAPVEVRSDLWPEGVQPLVTDCEAAVALTEPWNWRGRGRREAILLTRDAIAAARRSLYIETQYLASFHVGRAIARRLREADGPDVVVVTTRRSHGFWEKLMMGNNRDRLIRRLKRHDRHNRLRVMYPVVPTADGGEQEVIVHSKVVVVDDRFLRVGSSNLNNRSEGLDTECDIAFETADPVKRSALLGLRDDLLAEHLGVAPATVTAEVAASGSLVAALDRLNTGRRRLRHFAVDLDHGSSEPVTGTGLIDPMKPFAPVSYIRARAGMLLTRWFGSLGAGPRETARK